MSTATPRNKLVIRRLPPTLPEDVFWHSVSTWITEKTCLWKQYVKGKAADGNYDSNPVHSRAYVLMADPESLVHFHQAFDGHVFRSKAGAEYQAVVEYAPFQKTSYKSKIKPDSKQGTIDDDPDFLSFLEILNAPVAKPPLETSAPAPQPTSTPLLEHLRSQKPSGKGKNKVAASVSQPKVKAQPQNIKTSSQNPSHPHGKSSSQAKNQPQLSAAAFEASRRAAALASINAAAQRRTPQALSSPAMVAGKGREVIITNTTTVSSGTRKDQAGKGSGGEQETKGAKSKSSRKRNRGNKNKPTNEGESVTGASGDTQVPSGPSAPATSTPFVAIKGQTTTGHVSQIPNILAPNPSLRSSGTPAGGANHSKFPPQSIGGQNIAASNPGSKSSKRGGRGRGPASGNSHMHGSNENPAIQMKILPRNNIILEDSGPGGNGRDSQKSDAGATSARIDL
ncbi:uncharacterized protein L203_101538 [Cryptococcus depauperatus CBS 7841]|uniref:Uncharacterized protein n=1 Tax=Cryptococcus depauperatus CBS 7841 TaxID=1295531 RepID=A0A1E3ITS9_9TREE|nr:hypothetical protein L203_01098 [Cryptococcus depauperatus CBS 7841]